MARYAKYHGLGNDYLVLDPRSFPLVLTPARIQLLCDRHYGLGSDGILWGPLTGQAARELAVATPARDSHDTQAAGQALGLRIYNPDGSEAEKSGNGLRIFARHLFDTGQVGHGRFSVLTLGGPVSCVVHGTGESAAIEMGQASFSSGRIPVTGPERDVLNEELTVAGERLCYCAATVGNPHCVISCEELSPALAQRLGPHIEAEARFPRRTNVQFMRCLDRHTIQIEIWERGAGYTLASGSSSCAAAAVAVRLGRCASPVTVHMPGGRLTIAVGADWALTLNGPVAGVARGEVADDLFNALALLDGDAAAGGRSPA